jgi:hypothetical protein
VDEKIVTLIGVADINKTIADRGPSVGSTGVGKD